MLGNEQCGLRKDKEWMDQIYAPRCFSGKNFPFMTLEKKKKKKKEKKNILILCEDM